MASIKPQVNKVWINTNKALDEFPHDIQFADLVQPSIGPLGGIFSALNKIESEWIQFCPNDCPFLPEDLVKKMYAKKNSEHIKALLPLVNDKYEPTFLLCHRSVLRTITSFIEAKNYKIMDLDNPMIDENDKKYLDEVVNSEVPPYIPEQFVAFYNQDKLGGMIRNVDFWVKDIFEKLVIKK